MLFILFAFTASPFNEANFVALPNRSISVFSNPAGIGKSPGAELFFTYHPEIVNSGITIGNLGFGISKADSITNYEIGAGIKLPGVFSVGYSRQFGDKSENICGVICDLNQYLSLGYKTTLGRKKYMQAGAGVRILGSFLTLTGEMTYEGIEDFSDYCFGCIISPANGVKINFLSTPDWDWHIGIVLGTTKIKFGLMYAYKAEKKFTGGILVSAQGY